MKESLTKKDLLDFREKFIKDCKKGSKEWHRHEDNTYFVKVLEKKQNGSQVTVFANPSEKNAAVVLSFENNKDCLNFAVDEGGNVSYYREIYGAKEEPIAVTSSLSK